jgi:hypothetical protein
VRKGLLYASTENGVWVSFDDGAAWQSLQRNLPRSSARDIVVHDADLIVATHGRGFWIMDDVSALRQAAAGMPTTLYKPAAAVRTPRSLYTDTPVPPDEPLADNPPDGAVIDYYLDKPARDPVALEIRDARGQLVRRYTSTDPPDVAAPQLAQQLIPSYWVRPHQTLGTTAGGHRWVWDLRAERPLATSYSYPISAAPHDTPRTPLGAGVMPGTYAVKLIVDGKALTAALEVKLDPRIALPAAALAQQHQLATRLDDLITRSSRLVLQAQSVIDQLGKLTGKPEPLAGQIAAVTAKVNEVMSGPKGPPGPGRARPPSLGGVNGKLTNLGKMVDVDARPTAAQVAETAKAEKELAQLSAAWNAVKTGELTQLDAALTAAGLPAIRPEAEPETKQDDGDEE